MESKTFTNLAASLKALAVFRYECEIRSECAPEEMGSIGSENVRRYAAELADSTEEEDLILSLVHQLFTEATWAEVDRINRAIWQVRPIPTDIF